MRSFLTLSYACSILRMLPLFLGMLPLSVWAQASDAKPIVSDIQPRSVEAATESDVLVHGQTELCDPIFSNPMVVVQRSGTIRLSVVAENNPLAKCSAGPHPYTIHFHLPGLPVGPYEVSVYLLPLCAATGCLIELPEEYAGVLNAVAPGDMDYSIRPRKTVPRQAFSLFLANSRFGCANGFSGMAASVIGYTIRLDFVDSLRAGMECTDIGEFYGPTFPVNALDPGIYQVIAARQNPECLELPCPVGLAAPQPAGALTVEDTASLGTVKLRSAAGYRGDARAILRGGAVELPAGFWRYDLRGRGLTKAIR